MDSGVLFIDGSSDVFSSDLVGEQRMRLQSMETGGDLYSVLAPVVPADDWDRLPVELSLGGLVELHVEEGGRIEGAAGAKLTIPKLWNEGSIRLPGGTIAQSEILPLFYENALAVHSRSDEQTSELQSLMRISYAVFCLKKKIQNT